MISDTRYTDTTWTYFYNYLSITTINFVILLSPTPESTIYHTDLTRLGDHVQVYIFIF